MDIWRLAEGTAQDRLRRDMVSHCK